MKRTPLTLNAVGFAGLLTTSLLALPLSTAHAGDEAVAKRDDDVSDLALVADDDDDDPTGPDDSADTTGTVDTTVSQATGTNTGSTNTGTGTDSGDQNDPTNSRVTDVSQDRDGSRADLTRDLTQDGQGAQQRDWSANRTNDRSRNDTRR